MTELFWHIVRYYLYTVFYQLDNSGQEGLFCGAEGPYCGSLLLVLENPVIIKTLKHHRNKGLTILVTYSMKGQNQQI